MVINMEKLKKKRLFLLDMDGTIYLDGDLFDGTVDFLDYVKRIGGRYLFLTNNSSKSVEKYIEKLGTMGISAVKEDFLTSTDATVVELKRRGYRKIYAFGTESFREQLASSGLPVTDELSDGIDCLTMGYDTELTYKKLEDACILLGQGVDYIATNPDLVCPTRYGFAPDCGSVSTMLFNATRRMPEFIGKPQTHMVDLALKRTGYGKEDAMIMGDRLYTDIACGAASGITTVFVLSGEGTMADVESSETKPEYIFRNIREMYRMLTS